MKYRGWEIHVKEDNYGWFEYVITRKKIKKESPTSYPSFASASMSAEYDIDYEIDNHDKSRSNAGSRRLIKSYYRSKNERLRLSLWKSAT